MHRLSSRELRAGLPGLWPSRLIVTGLLAWLVVSFVMADVVAYDGVPNRAPIGSPEYLAYGGSLVFLVLAVTLWWAPRVSLAGVVLFGFGLAPYLGSQGLVATVAALVAAVALMVTVRADLAARPRGELFTVEAPRFAETLAGSQTPWQRIRGWAALALCAVAAVVLLAWHAVASAEQATFEAEAQRHTATVVEFDDVDYLLTVTVDGETHEVVDAYEAEPGQRVEVWLRDGEIQLVDAPVDDSWMIGLALSTPFLAASAWSVWIAPARRRQALVRNGARGATVRVINHDETYVMGVDGPWPVLRLTHLQGLATPEDAEAAEARVMGFDEGEDDEDDAEGEFDDGEQLPMEEDELIAWLDEGEMVSADDLPADDKALVESLWGPDTAGTEPFILVGNRAVGSSVALLRETGQVWFAEVAEATPLSGARRLVTRGSTATSWDDVPDSSSPKERLAVWARGQARWLRWAIAPAVGACVGVLLAWSLSEGLPEDTFGWVLFVVRALFVLAWVPGALMWTFSEPVPVRGGVVFPGLVTDEVVGADRVARVVAARDVAGLRLVEPDELHVFEPGALSPGDTPEAEAAELRAVFATPGPRSGKRPGPVLLGLATVAVAFVVTMLAG